MDNIFSETHQSIGLSFLLSFTFSFILIPFIIFLSRKYALMDAPDHRKIHHSAIPTMGGIGIFISLILTSIIFLPLSESYELIALLSAASLLFILGLIDDVKDVSAYYKFIVQIIAVLIIASTGIRIESFNGFLGIYSLPIFIQYAFTVVVVVGIINAINMIDGLDSLAGGIGLINSLFLAIMFYFQNNTAYCLLSTMLAGSLIGFLYFNFNPAKIFMGDTGSLPLGFLLSVLTIKYIQFDITLINSNTPLVAPVIIAIGLFMIPVADTLRVMTERILQNKSPFQADQNHLHHRILKLGFSHKSTAVLIFLIHISVIAFSVLAYQIHLEEFALTTGSILMIASFCIRIDFDSSQQLKIRFISESDFSEKLEEKVAILEQNNEHVPH